MDDKVEVEPKIALTKYDKWLIVLGESEIKAENQQADQ